MACQIVIGEDSMMDQSHSTSSPTYTTTNTTNITTTTTNITTTTNTTTTATTTTANTTTAATTNNNNNELLLYTPATIPSTNSESIDTTDNNINTKTNITFYQSLLDRYMMQELPEDSKLMRVRWNMTNLEKDGCKLGSLKTVGLDGRGISTAGIPPEGLKQLCPNVSSVYLEENNLTNWNEVSLILREFAHLQDCDLSCNAITVSPETILSDITQFAKLVSVVLSKTFLKWEDLHFILQHCPAITSLTLCSNNFTMISQSATSALSNIEMLNLCDNCITDWREVEKLRALSKLNTLHLSDNPITFPLAAVPHDVTTEEQYFSSLQCLSLGGVKIDSWQALSIINTLPVLSTLRLQDVPKLDNNDITPSDIRKVIIGWFANISKLNGSQISSEERIDSERFFIRHFYVSTYKPPNLSTLISKHGELKPIPVIDFSLGYKEYVKLEILHNNKRLFYGKICMRDSIGTLIEKYARQLRCRRRQIMLMHVPLSANSPHQGEKLLLTGYGMPLSRFYFEDNDQIILEIRE